MSVHQKSESGYVLVTVALLLFVLLGFTALAIDIGSLLSDRTQIQQAADAAALSGAYTFTQVSDTVQPATAIAHATQTAINNQVMGDPITAAQVSVCVGTVAADGTCTVDVTQRRVAVTIQRQQSTFFGRVFGATTFDVNTGARGVAEAEKGACGARCVKPFFIPNTILSTLGANSKACDACVTNPKQILVDSNGETTQFAMDRYGTQVSVHAGNPATALGPGQFYAIDIPSSKFVNGCPGGDCYRTAIATCLTSVLVCQKFYSVKTGAMVGPTKQGINDLIGDPPTDTYVNLQQYRWGSDSKIHQTSKALVIAPIWDACNMPGFCPASKLPNSGTNVSLKIVGFALIFIQSVSGGGDVQARLVRVAGCAPGTPCGTGGGDGGNDAVDGSGAPLYPLRLVRMP